MNWCAMEKARGNRSPRCLARVSITPESRRELFCLFRTRVAPCIAFPFASVHRIHSHHRAVRARAAVCLSDLTCPWTMPLPASVHPVHMSIPPPRFKVYLGARSGRQRARWAGLRLVVAACRSLGPHPSHVRTSDVPQNFTRGYLTFPHPFHPPQTPSSASEHAVF